MPNGWLRDSTVGHICILMRNRLLPMKAGLRYRALAGRILSVSGFGFREYLEIATYGTEKSHQ